MYWTTEYPEAEGGYYYWKKFHDSQPTIVQIFGFYFYEIASAQIHSHLTNDEQQFLGPLPTVEDLLAIDDIDRELA